LPRSGQRVQQALLFKAGDVFRQLVIFLLQALQGGAQAVGCVDARQQLLVHRRLADEVVDAVVEGLAEGIFALATGEQDDVAVVAAAGVALTNLAGELQAVHFRHQPVRQQNVGGTLGVLREGIGSAAGEAYVLIAGFAQRAADHDAGEFGIVDDEDAQLGVGHGELNELEGDVLSLRGRALTRRIAIMTALS